MITLPVITSSDCICFLQGPFWARLFLIECTHMKAKSLKGCFFVKLITLGDDHINHDRHKQQFEIICNDSTIKPTFSIRKCIYWSLCWKILVVSFQKLLNLISENGINTNASAWGENICYFATQYFAISRHQYGMQFKKSIRHAT